MTVIYHDKPAQCWVVSREAKQPDWVQEAFAQHKLEWVGNRVRVLLPALNNKWFKEGGSGFFGGYVMADIGDVLDVTNCKVVSPDYYKKHYQVEE